MAYIQLPPDHMGMRALMAFRPHLASSLSAFTSGILSIDEGLSKGERELIGTLVSALNECRFCENVHGAVVECLWNDDGTLIEQVKQNYASAPISDKLKALLSIAVSVQKGGKNVTQAQIQNARELGATDVEIHDTVLIAATFCMFNRYMDGLGIDTPDDPELYKARAHKIVEAAGYGISAETSS